MIDVHRHYLLPEWAEQLWPADTRGSSFWPKLGILQGLLADPALSLAAMEMRSIEHGLIYPDLSCAPGPQTPGGSTAALKLIQKMNDMTARIVDRFPGHFIGIAVANPLGNQNDLAETRRAIVALGLQGIAVASSYRGISIDVPAARPFLDLVTALDVPLILHPTADGAYRQPRDYGMDLLLGMPTELAAAAIRLIVSGRLAEFPRLKVVLPHLGGGLLMLLEWLDVSVTTVTPRPMIQAQRFYFDTAASTAETIAFAARVVGADRLMYGSDWPFSPSADMPLETLDKLPLTPLEKAAIGQGTAQQLFGL
jgi:predicted TIM-barrel fold metal-dependent hydrolase